ncbi:alpha-defensin 14-like protein [Cricetulus griseus]|uniref:Alpha-defensin 14-like protein n=1 Tax=Cricetulus griseus TaxID=10029 RepID=A0A061IG06_CRIGR|nr:alpha-defensin 14-like protein [Cricetulus griseus]
MKTLVVLSALVLLAFQALADPLPEATEDAKGEEQLEVENQDMSISFGEPEGSVLQDADREHYRKSPLTKTSDCMMPSTTDPSTTQLLNLNSGIIMDRARRLWIQVLVFSQVLDAEQTNTDASSMEDSVSAPVALPIPGNREPVNQISPTAVGVDNNLKNEHQRQSIEDPLSLSTMSLLDKILERIKGMRFRGGSVWLNLC